MKKHFSFKRTILISVFLALLLALVYFLLVIRYTVNEKNNCLEEGEYYSWRDHNNHPPCCSGLKAITRDIEYNETFDCSMSLSSPQICLKCGDQICGHGENACNCPTDCVEEDSKITVIWE